MQYQTTLEHNQEAIVSMAVGVVGVVEGGVS